MKRKLMVAIAFVTSLLTLDASNVTADIYIDAGTFATTSTWATGDYTTGTEFTVTGDPLPVDQLGYIDAVGDGLSISHQVGLWRVSDQALLASVVVTPGSTTQASAHGQAVWYLENIGSTIMLNPGVYRVAGFTGSADSETLAGDRIGNGVSLSNGYVRTSFPGGGFNYPNLSFGTNGVRTTVGYSQAIPEPTAGIALVLMGGVVCLRRRKKK